MIEMTLEIADRAARGALAKAAAMGIGMTVCVVDEAGRLVVAMKGDRIRSGRERPRRTRSESP